MSKTNAAQGEGRNVFGRTEAEQEAHQRDLERGELSAVKRAALEATFRPAWIIRTDTPGSRAYHWLSGFARVGNGVAVAVVRKHGGPVEDVLPRAWRSSKKVT